MKRIATKAKGRAGVCTGSNTDKPERRKRQSKTGTKTKNEIWANRQWKRNITWGRGFLEHQEGTATANKAKTE
jgi:hypothetical protein